MAADVTYNAFEPVCHVHDLADFLIRANELAKFLGLLYCLGQRHSHFERNELREFVGKSVGFALYPRHIAYDRLGRHGAKCDDLTDRITAISFGYVVNYFVAAFHAEIDVEIRHRHALGI